MQQNLERIRKLEMNTEKGLTQIDQLMKQHQNEEISDFEEETKEYNHSSEGDCEPIGSLGGLSQDADDYL